MHKVDSATAATVQPAIGPVGPKPGGFFTEANPSLGIAATKVDQAWLNAVQNEICNVITGAGLTLDKSLQNQLYTAINTLIASNISDLPSVVIKTVTQNGHGFSENELLYNNGTVWTRAIATGMSTSWTVGMVYEVQSTNIFKILMLGWKDGFTGLTKGATYYLSTTVAGAMQSSRPNVEGLVIKPVFIADSTTSGYFYNFVPIPYGSGGGGGDLLAANNLDDLADIPTARVNLGLEIGVDVQAYSEALASIAGLTTAANKMIYTTDLDTYDVADLTEFARTLLAAADADAAKTVLEVSGGMTMTPINTNTNLVVNRGYILTGGGTLTLTLPATCAVGDIIYIKGSGATGWIIAPNTGQNIYLYNQVGLTGATGTLISYDARDSVELVCTVANTTWETTGRGNGFPGITTA